MMRILMAGAVLLTSLFAASNSVGQEPKKYRVYIGTYTNKDGSKGIYRCDLDLTTGKLSEPVLAAESNSPSFLAIHPNGQFLYSVNEVGNFDGKKTGAVSAFAIDAQTGDLKALNQAASEGTGPCHLVVDKAGKNVLAANYGGGSICCLPIAADGKLGPATAAIKYDGPGKSGRQPHAHSIYTDNSNRFVATANLGLDQVFVYRFDPAKGTLTPSQPPSAEVAVGAGPRHFAFHPDGKHAYVINESNLTVTAFDWDADKGVLKSIQTITTLPPDFKGKGLSTAEVQVHPSGKFLYGSNRGHNSIAVFSIDPKTGELTPVQHAMDGIRTPRNFGIDPSGKFMLVGSQSGDEVIVFRIDPTTGKLEPTGQTVKVGAPVCIKFLALK